MGELKGIDRWIEGEPGVEIEDDPVPEPPDPREYETSLPRAHDGPPYTRCRSCGQNLQRTTQWFELAWHRNCWVDEHGEED